MCCSLTDTKGEPHKVAHVKPLKDEGKAIREHAKVLDEEHYRLVE